MQKISILILLTVNSVYGQNLINTFKIGNYIEVLPADSIKAYFDCGGALVDKSCANFYRIGKIDSAQESFIGDFRDYYINDKIFFKSSIKGGSLNGRGIFYFPNGQAKESGYYSNGKRVGLWKYFYENGNLQQILIFKGDSVLIGTQYDKKNIATVTNGTGFYQGTFTDIGDCKAYYSASGNVKDGKPDGKWIIHNNFIMTQKIVEEYHLGIFKKGVDYIDNTNFTNPFLKVSGYYENENYLTYRRLVPCRGDVISMITLNSKPLDSVFFPNLIAKIKANGALKSKWLMVAVDFNGRKIKDVNIYSSTNDNLIESLIKGYISNISGWEPVKIVGIHSPQPFFFTINVRNDDVEKTVKIQIEDEYGQGITEGGIKLGIHKINP